MAGCGKTADSTPFVNVTVAVGVEMTASQKKLDLAIVS